MKVKCYTTFAPDSGIEFEVRPAPAERSWIDATPKRFATRCLPLLIANAHGWEVLLKDSCEITWTGGSSADDIKVTTGSGDKTYVYSHFGQGIVTFKIFGLFRTEPQFNMWVGGPINRFKDGIQALTGIVETDWSPMTFTMNWKVTRAGHPVRFEHDEPICHVFPMPRGIVDQSEPEMASLDSDPELKRDFEQAKEDRLAFNEGLRSGNPDVVKRGWQKDYFRGAFPSGRRAFAGHQTKVNPKPFLRKS